MVDFVQLQNLKELRQVNKRLDAVEDQRAGPSLYSQLKEHHETEPPKISSLSPCISKKKASGK